MDFDPVTYLLAQQGLNQYAKKSPGIAGNLVRLKADGNYEDAGVAADEITGRLSSAIDTAGTGLAKSGTTLNHSNSVTAKSNTNMAGVSYDAQGHITGKGTEYEVTTSLTSASTDTQLPTAKAVYDMIGLCKVEHYALQDVFDLTDPILILKISDTMKQNVTVTCITDRTGTGFMNFGLYADSTVSKSSTGWKSLGLSYQSNFPYVHKPVSLGSVGTEIVRTLASMWVSTGYVNTVVTVSGYKNSIGYQSGAFQTYYTNAMVNQTGGFNMNVTIPIVAKTSLSNS